ncbi:MAG: hypothetical protein M1828_006627 [Chrysothrix sp. TS-e1954]|nr:MAG: hypothetical protein M1828_006627 [Chrysothrix sp. TS-e1954]
MDHPPPSRVELVQGLDISFMILTIISMVLRLWSRLVTHGGGLWWDDYLALLGGLFAVGEGATMLVGVSFGYAVPVRYISSEANLYKGLKNFYAGQVIFGICIGLVKYSALLFYGRVFGHNQKFRRWVWAAAVVMLSWVAAMFLLIFQCIPVHKFWDFKTPGHCISNERQYDWTAALDLALDIMILLLPMPMVWGLQMTRARKVLVSGVFFCGYCALLTSIGRLISTIIDSPHITEDPDWNSVTMILWTVSETYISVISINVPSCFQLFKRASKKGLWSLFTRDTYADEAPSSSRPKSGNYSSDTYGFSPIEATFSPMDATFSGKVQPRKSVRRSYVNRLSAHTTERASMEDDDKKLLTELSPVHIRKDITVVRDDDDQGSPV